jgi:hypothetical protein
MALVQPRVDARWLAITGPGMPEIAVPLRPDGIGTERVAIWTDWCDARRVDARADAWFSDLVGEPVRLVYLPPDSFRQIDPRYAKPGERVSFADGFPLLLTTDGSLDGLNARLDAPVPMDRFRPNVVVRGAAPFEEDRWRRVRMSGVEMRVAKPCARCVMVTVDQATGVAAKEPLKTLSTFRRHDGRVLFGQNLIHEAAGELIVGDPVDVLEATPG